jgi:hypothetical protein
MEVAMKLRPLVLALCAALALPTAVGAAPAAGCGDRFAAERLGADGASVTFDAPQPPAPELAAANHPAVTAGRSANFYFVADLAPSPKGKVTFDLGWAQPSDYDLFVFNAAGAEIGRSAAANVDDPAADPLGEQLTLPVTDCQLLHVAVRSWAGVAQPLTLELRVSDLAAATPDVEARTDDRVALYLGGARPGQVGMTHGDPNNLDTPPEARSALVGRRPTGNQPNSYTRPLLGFNNPRNLLQAHFTAPVTSPIVVDGAPTARLWLSTPTQALEGDQAGTFFARLFVDGTEVGKPVAIPARTIDPWPTPVLVEFAPLTRQPRSSITLQVSAEPVASSTGTTSPLGNGAFTLWYDSVQYPSRLVLP